MTRRLLHFLLIGACLLGATRGLDACRAGAGAARGAARIVIPAERVDAIRREALRRTGRPPAPDELRVWIDAEVADEILVREALALGLAERDPVVRRRLARSMERLSGLEARRSGAIAAAADAAALHREALALGREGSDPVVRRRLIQRMRLAIEAGARAAEPSEAELARHLARHAKRYAAPARVRLSHVFVSSARGEAAEAHAHRLLGRLVRAGPRAARPRGDLPPAPADLPLLSERALAGLFGPDFAARAMRIPAGAWAGPVRSAYGLHLVRVHEREPGGTPPLDQVRSAVREAILAERGERAVREAVAELRSRYRVEIATARGAPARPAP